MNIEIPSIKGSLEFMIIGGGGGGGGDLLKKPAGVIKFTIIFCLQFLVRLL